MIKFRGELGFLSNMYASPMYYHGRVIRTVEHGFFAQSTYDEDWREKILAAPTPSEAKRLGKLAPMKNGWGYLRVPAMLSLLIAKFNIPELKRKLKKVPDEDLVEYNEWHDNFWGDCTCERCKDIEGKNVLGRLLQIVKRML